MDPADRQEPSQNLPNKNKRWSAVTFVFLFLALAGLDQLAKHFAAKVFRNQAFAFSLPVPIWLIYAIYVFVLLGIIYYVIKNQRNFTWPTRAAWTLIFAGALANVGERIVLGYVRDFIYISFYKWTGIYNLADFYILLGILILLFHSQPANQRLNSSHDSKNF